MLPGSFLHRIGIDRPAGRNRPHGGIRGCIRPGGRSSEGNDGHDAVPKLCHRRMEPRPNMGLIRRPMDMVGRIEERNFYVAFDIVLQFTRTAGIVASLGDVRFDGEGLAGE